MPLGPPGGKRGLHPHTLGARGPSQLVPLGLQGPHVAGCSDCWAASVGPNQNHALGLEDNLRFLNKHSIPPAPSQGTGPATGACTPVACASAEQRSSLLLLGQGLLLGSSQEDPEQKTRGAFCSAPLLPHAGAVRGGLGAVGPRYLPGGGVHDAASFVRSHSAAAAPLQSVVVHPEIVAQLVCQGHGRTKGAV